MYLFISLIKKNKGGENAKRRIYLLFVAVFCLMMSVSFASGNILTQDSNGVSSSPNLGLVKTYSNEASALTVIGVDRVKSSYLQYRLGSWSIMQKRTVYINKVYYKYKEYKPWKGYIYHHDEILSYGNWISWYK